MGLSNILQYVTGSVGGIDCDTVGDTILKSLRRDDLQATVVEDFVDIEQIVDVLFYAVGKDSVLFDCGGKCIASSQEQLVGLDAGQSQGNRKLNCSAFCDRSAVIGYYRGPSASIKPRGGVYRGCVAVVSLAYMADEDVRESVLARFLILNWGKCDVHLWTSSSAKRKHIRAYEARKSCRR